MCHKESVTPSGEAYGGSYGIYMAGGQFLGVDKITQTLKMIYEGHINIDKILDGKITISDKLDVTCPTINIKGNVNITGNVSISGNEKVGGNSTIAGTMHATNYDAHKHTGNLGEPTSGPDQ